MQSVQDKIVSHLIKRNISPEHEIRVYLISHVAVFFCLLTHLYLIVTFAAFGQVLFGVLNTVSVVVYLALILLLRGRKYTAAALILSLDVTAYATVFIFLAGISTYIVGYYLLVAILQAVLPYGSDRMRLGVLATVVVVGLPGIVASLGTQPMVALPQSLENFLTVSNIYILFLGTMAQLYIGSMVNRIIGRLGEIRVEELSVLAHTDSLTGLYNRRYADICFAALHRDIPNCVAMLDIDDFKMVNDTWGHACGDQVLVYLADFIRGSLRRSDRVFRWGGEEFLMVLEGVGLETAQGILEKLRAGLEQSVIPTAQAEIRITATIGVAPLDPLDIPGSIRRCDEKLYQGKQRSKNAVVA